MWCRMRQFSGNTDAACKSADFAFFNCAHSKGYLATGMHNRLKDEATLALLTVGVSARSRCE